MILSDFIGHRSFIQGNLQSEEDYYPFLGRRRRREISAVICLQICFEIFCLPVLFVVVLQKVKMLSITCLDARTSLTRD